MPNQKSEKAERRRIRREFQSRYIDIATAIAKDNGRMLKTKPRWVPMFLWIRGLRIFVKIK